MNNPISNLYNAYQSTCSWWPMVKSSFLSTIFKMVYSNVLTNHIIYKMKQKFKVCDDLEGGGG